MFKKYHKFKTELDTLSVEVKLLKEKMDIDFESTKRDVLNILNRKPKKR